MLVPIVNDLSWFSKTERVQAGVYLVFYTEFHTPTNVLLYIIKY